MMRKVIVIIGLIALASLIWSNSALNVRASDAHPSQLGSSSNSGASDGSGSSGSTPSGTTPTGTTTTTAGPIGKGPIAPFFKCEAMSPCKEPDKVVPPTQTKLPECVTITTGSCKDSGDINSVGTTKSPIINPGCNAVVGGPPCGGVTKPSTLTGHHTKAYLDGAKNGANDGKVGIYDPVAACPGGNEHCIIGYKTAYVANCTHGKFGCGDGPTTPPIVPTPTKPLVICVAMTPCPKPTPPPTPPLPTIPDNCKYIDNGSKVVCHDKDGKTSSSTTIIKYIGGGYTGGAVQSSGIVMLPSTATDFANNDPKTLTLDFVNPTGPDSIGNYWIKGEVVNNGNSTVQNLKITAHWFDAGNKIIGVTYGYTDKLNTNLNSGDRSTFSIMADGHNDLIGTPRFVELSYDWQ